MKTARLSFAFLAAAIVFSCAAPYSAKGEPVSASQAKTAARNWLKSGRAFGAGARNVASVRKIEKESGAGFYVVSFEGGGFAIVSADTSLTPVVAFSGSAVFPESGDNPLLDILVADSAARTGSPENEAEWQELLNGGMRLFSSGDGVEKDSLTDVRVEPLLESKWGQGSIGESMPCFNYYTPNNDPCGCVATAAAQIMRHHEYPLATEYFAPFQCEYCTIDGTPATLTTQGGCYDWGLMPFEPNSGSTEAERQMIGKLTSDIGICCGMMYSASGSNIGTYMLRAVLTANFGYGTALAAQWPLTSDQSMSAGFRNALISNLDAGFPVVIGINRGQFGHAVVGDGYGYSGDSLFIHMNFGWSGIGDAWYSPPKMDTGTAVEYNFNIVNGFVFNIMPHGTDSTVIYSGRVLDGDGVPVENATVSWRPKDSAIEDETNSGHVETNGKGMFALLLEPGTYIVSASYGTLNVSRTVAIAANSGVQVSYPNSYIATVPVITDRCNQDFVLTGVSSVVEPVFTPSPGKFHPSVNVSISCATPGAVIRYTLDGSVPTAESAVYTGPITLSDDTMVTARAWAGGMNPSEAITATYTYDPDVTGPKGDMFADPMTVSGLNGIRTIKNNSSYTVEENEPHHTLWIAEDGQPYYYYQYNTMWFRYFAADTAFMTFTTRLVSGNLILPSFIAVYEGDSIASITRIAYDADDDQDYYATVSFVAEKGHEYKIVGMSGWPHYPGEYEAFTLSWSATPAIVTGYSGVYDGLPHGVAVTVAGGTEGVTVKYAKGSSSEFSPVPPTLTDVGSMPVRCEISLNGHVICTNSAGVSISRRQVVLESGSASKEYDGTALTCPSVVAGGGGFAAGEGASYFFSGSQTEIGESANAFSYALNANTKAENYDISLRYGRLVVEKPSATLWPEEPSGTAPQDVASNYDGFLYDGAGRVAGTVSAKIAKSKNGLAKTTITVIPSGGKKISLKGALDLETGLVSGLGIRFGSDGMSGEYNGFKVSGSRNLFASKDKSESASANAVLAKWSSAPVCVAWSDSDALPCNTLSLSFGSKGKVKVSGALAGGTKVSASCQMIIGEEWSCVPVSYAKKGVEISFSLWVRNDGSSARISGLGDGAVASAATPPPDGCTFRLAGAIPVAIGSAPVLDALLPSETVSISGGKWNVPKAEKVAYKNGVLTYGANPSGLKISYKPKTGEISGSFTIYTLDGGKLKKYKATVTGVAIGGAGYGSASVKKIGSCRFEIR